MPWLIFSILQIYGIRCHLLYKFSITERDWYRIKQNMDSKCRTAWKKKVRGLPLGGFKVSWWTEPILYNECVSIVHKENRAKYIQLEPFFLIFSHLYAFKTLPGFHSEWQLFSTVASDNLRGWRTSNCCSWYICGGWFCWSTGSSGLCTYIWQRNSIFSHYIYIQKLLSPECPI